MSSMPENVNYGDPNAYPTNFFTEAAMEQQKTEQNASQINQPQGQQTQQDKNTKEKEKDSVFNFLNMKATTIITLATAVAIGLSLKDVLNSLVHNIIQPVIFNIIMTIDKNNYLPITPALRDKNVPLDFSKFLGSTLVVKLVVDLMYFMNKYEIFLF